MGKSAVAETSSPENQISMSRTFPDGDENRITVEDDGELVTITRSEKKNPKGRFAATESVCMSSSTWQAIIEKETAAILALTRRRGS